MAQQLVGKCLTDDCRGVIDPDPMECIARGCGWLPLVIGEKMTVTFDNDQRYEIKRVEDR